jgi:DNA-binding GntR family transcriptional regulator
MDDNLTLLQKLGPIQPRTAGGEVYRTLRGAILNGVLAPGRRLVEEELAKELAASRTPVRESLIMLEFEGLVQRSRRGLEVRTFTRQELNDMYEIRVIMEGHLVAQAASQVTPEDVRDLKAICQEADVRYQQGFDSEGEQIWWLVLNNRQFHERIAQVVQNRKLVQMVQQVADLPLLYKAMFWRSPEHVRLSLHYHRTIAQALADHDHNRAELVMREHIYEARDLMLDFMDTGSAPERGELWDLMQAWIHDQMGEGGGLS